MAELRNGDISFWYADMGGLPRQRPALSGDTTADICIIGAGYTGLWTAYYLKKSDPTLNIVIVEKEFAGFGASGRNGGWLTGGFAWDYQRYLATSSRDSLRAMIRVLASSVDEVLRVAQIEGIDADIRPIEELLIGTNPAQMQRLHQHYAERMSWQVPEDRVRMLDQNETRARIDVAGALGAMAVAGVARIQPAKLVRGLAQVVERSGVRLYEGTAVVRIAPGQVTTDHGTVRAPIVLRATEGFTATLPKMRRDWLPLNSAQVVTAPMPDRFWDRIGWHGDELFGDFAHSYSYAQRTREGRIAMGGRGVPYRMGSGLDYRGETHRQTVQRLIAKLHRHFPQTKDTRIDHAWCGVLGVPRDWCATVGLDPATGLGWAGGYVGVGVATSNLAGRTLADLVTGRETLLTTLPWVNRTVRNWEPEPLRWLGINGVYKLLDIADRREAGGLRRTSRVGELAEHLMHG